MFSNCLVIGLLTSIVLKSRDTHELFHLRNLTSKDIALHCMHICKKMIYKFNAGASYSALCFKLGEKCQNKPRLVPLALQRL